MGGGGKLSKDSACGLESWISSACGVDRPQVLSSLQALKSPDSSTTILESTISLESKAALESKKLDSRNSAISPSLRGGGKATNEAIHKQSLDSSEQVDCHADKSARNDRKIDSSQSSSRASEASVAIQSNQSRGTRNLESVQGDWGFKGDKGERFAISPPVPLEKDLSQVELESSQNTKKVESLESSFAKLDSSSEAVDCHANATALARNDKNSNSADCHDFANANSRNDRKNSAIGENLDSISAPIYHKLSPKSLLTLGIIFNLCLLGVFKYTDFFLENFNLFSKLLHLDFTIPLPHILLPLALSFVTFQQIAFLVDCYKQTKNKAESKALESSNPNRSFTQGGQGGLNCEVAPPFTPKAPDDAFKVAHKCATIDCMDFANAKYQKTILDSSKAKSPKEIPHINFLDYCLFITFFPQLIAGPIVHHREMMPQFYAMSKGDLAFGLESKSTLESKKLSSRADTIGEAIHNKKVDSRIPQSLESQQTTGDSKIVDEKCGLEAKAQGSCLKGNDRRAFVQLPHLSLQAESLKKPSIIHWEYIAKGLFIFSIGLFKKVVIADSFAKWANAGFSAVESGSVLNLFESWAVSLSYSFELYFDFSGYCDMAIGLGLLFGIVLPLNFSSPYKALNIAEFWRKWHITLGRFLKEYLYIPLGGSHNSKRVVSLLKNGDYSGSSAVITTLGNSLDSPCKAPFFTQRYCREKSSKLESKQPHSYREVLLNHIFTLRNLFIVAFLSGVWHGAGFGFVIWGSLHGVAMVVHRIYMLLCKRLDSKSLYRRFMQSRIYLVLCWLLTFNFINIAWVFFRAENVQGALNLLKGMFFGEVVLPKSLESSAGALSKWGVGFDVSWIANVVKFESSVFMLIFLIAGFVITLFSHNSYELTKSLRARIYPAMLCAALLAICLCYIGGNDYSAFLYFNF